MMKSVLSGCAILNLFLISLQLNAQGSLEFNQVKLISQQEDTVPQGKVWKVVAYFGFEQYYNACIQYSGNSNLSGVNRLVACGSYFNATSTSSGRFNYTSAEMIINGITLVLETTGFNAINANNHWNSPNCSGSQWNYGNPQPTFNFNCANIGPDGKLPIWLPAGSRLKSNGSNTFLSVIEFNVI
jgi:hypothetical protein